MARRIPGVLVAALAALALSGCDSVPRTKPAEAASLPPGVEALAYLPARASVVAVVDTDLDGRRWRAARALARRAGLEGRLFEVVEELDGAGLDVGEGRELLGNLLAWAPRERVAALVVSDSALLARLVELRLRSGAMRDGGLHRGARLLLGKGIAVAARDGVLVAAPDARSVRRALDRRERDAGYHVERFKRALEGLPVESLVRVAVDVRALPAPPRAAREIPWLDALERAGVAFGVAGGGARVAARLDLDEHVLGADAPLPTGEGRRVSAPRPRPGALHVALADLPHLLSAAHRAVFAAAPALTARAELAALVARGRRRIDPARTLLATLAGPASVQVDAGGSVLLRAPVRRERTAAKAVDRLSARLPRLLGVLGVDRVVMRRVAGLEAAVRDTEVLALFGVRAGNLVVGSGRPRALRRLASTDMQNGRVPLHAALGLRASRRALDALLGIPAHARGELSATPRGLRGELRLRP